MLAILERNPLFRQQLGTGSRFLTIIDRMRANVAQRERAGARGLLGLTGLLAPAP